MDLHKEIEKQLKKYFEFLVFKVNFGHKLYYKDVPDMWRGYINSLLEQGCYVDTPLYNGMLEQTYAFDEERHKQLLYAIPGYFEKTEILTPKE